MTHEERANWIRRIFVLLICAGVAAGAWFYQRKEKAPPPVVAEEPQHEYKLTVYHFHEPGNPDSEALADHLNEITREYGQVVLVKRVDIAARPLDAAKENIEKAPKTVMVAGGRRVFEFQGLWDHPRLEAKVDEILAGLERATKDWRPEVKGMTPAGSATATTR